MQKNNFLRRTVFIVASINLIYFFIEFLVALNIKSVSLFADSIDFIEDALVNLLIFFAISWSLIKRAKTSMLLSLIMLMPGIAALWAVWEQISNEQPPSALEISVIGLGALVVNCLCTLILMKYRNHSGSLTKAAFLSARNDAVANIAVIFAGIITMAYPSIWPDIIIGLIIAFIRAESALEVYTRAKNEYHQAKKKLI